MMSTGVHCVQLKPSGQSCLNPSQPPYLVQTALLWASGDIARRRTRQVSLYRDKRHKHETYSAGSCQYNSMVFFLKLHTRTLNRTRVLVPSTPPFSAGSEYKLEYNHFNFGRVRVLVQVPFFGTSTGTSTRCTRTWPQPCYKVALAFAVL